MISRNKKSIIKLVHIPLPLQETMNILTESSTVATWFGASRANVDPREGGKYEIYWVDGSKDDSTLKCKIQELTSSNLVVSWRGPSTHANFVGMEKPGSTIVEFDLKSEENKTSVTITHRRFRASESRNEALKYYEYQWDIWARNLELVGIMFGKIAAAQEIMNQLHALNPSLTGTPKNLIFTPAPGKGERERFDFTKISVESGRLFGSGNGPLLRNVVDQA